VRPRCSFMGCKSTGIWSDDDDARTWCGAHLIYVIAPAAAEDESRQKRADFAAEYARDAAREARES
jgi:hypothetical protein